MIFLIILMIWVRNAIGRVYYVAELTAAGTPLTDEKKRASRMQFVLLALPMGSPHAVDFGQDSRGGIVTEQPNQL